MVTVAGEMGRIIQRQHAEAGKHFIDVLVIERRKQERFEKRCESGVKVPQFWRNSRWSSE
jgi:hypothetical protein